MTLILDANDLVGVLDYPTAIEAVDGAFRDLGSGNAFMPVRHTIRVEAHEGVSAFMPAYLPRKDARSFWTPLYSLFRPVALRMGSYVFSPLVKNSDNRALRGHRQSCSRRVLFGLIH